MEEINDKLDLIIKSVENLSQYVKNIEKKISTCNSNIKEIKIESFEMDIEYLRECLESNSIKSDFCIIKKIYFSNDENFYPIRINNQKKFLYWLDNKWNNDNEKYVANILSKNLKNCYLKINTFENYKHNNDLFLSNQLYINKLSDEKYKDSLEKMIKTFLEKNTF